MDPCSALAAEYSGKAVAYARHWSPVIRPMALPLFPALPLARATRVLDVGTGTGALWADLQEAAPAAHLLGIDRSIGMLRSGSAPKGRVAMMDGQQLGLRHASIDVAVLVFVLFHLPDPVRGLRELLPVLKPGGVLGLTSWGFDPGLPGAGIWAEELERAGAAPDPRDPSVMRQALMDMLPKLRELLVTAGYRPLRLWSQRFVHQWELERVLAVQLGCGLPARRLSNLEPEARAVCESRVRSRMAGLTRAELSYRTEVLFGVAARPG
jgi:ubiquinone/menaquinone biosynthesis C-methylase UbiE